MRKLPFGGPDTRTNAAIFKKRWPAHHGQSPAQARTNTIVYPATDEPQVAWGQRSHQFEMQEMRNGIFGVAVVIYP
jgi:hypothetical protein